MVTILHKHGCRCDARCYGAKTGPERCRCICGGAHHGIGLRGVLDSADLNSAQVHRIESAARRPPRERGRRKTAAGQGQLFPEVER